MIAALALWSACSLPCPPGLVRVDGYCQSAVAPGPGRPLTELEFRDRYDQELCDALEDCACEGVETGDCEPDLDCPNASWPFDCRFDGLAARDCVHGRFSCDTDGEEYAVTPPSACAHVFACDTGDTGTSAP